jgi:hypothetical protein
VVFKIPYEYDYITKVCRTQAEVIQTYVVLKKKKPCRGSIKTLKHGCRQAYDLSAGLPAVSEQLNKLRHNLLHKPTLTENLVYLV